MLERIRSSPKLQAFEAHGEAYIGLVMLAVYTTLILWNVGVRTLGQSSIMVPDLLSYVLGGFTWVAWLAAAYGIRQESHFRFLLLRDKLGSLGQLLLYALEWALWFLVVGLIFLKSFEILQLRMSTGAVTGGIVQIPVFLFYLAIPIGFGLMLLRVIQQLVGKIRLYRAGKSIAPTSEI